jgi:hypothetical protein
MEVVYPQVGVRIELTLHQAQPVVFPHLNTWLAHVITANPQIWLQKVKALFKGIVQRKLRWVEIGMKW